MKERGAHLNKLWRVGAAHALYIHDGHWYHRLERFPGALFDRNGYVLFLTAEEYLSSPHLQIGQHVHVRKPGISGIPGYVRMVPPGESSPPTTVGVIEPGRARRHSLKKGSTNLAAIVAEINSQAISHPIGALQVIRGRLKRHRPPTPKIFSWHTTRGDYAFHHGGRTELQFNVGIEEDVHLRHGVAFSLETSRTLPSIDVLVHKVRRFNEFFQIHPYFFDAFKMWHFEGKVRSISYPPAPIPAELIRPHVFICLGKRQPVKDVDVELILGDFDSLLPLYEYVEGEEAFPTTTEAFGFKFRPGCAVRRRSAIVSQEARVLDIQLRHNELQSRLYRQLADQHGVENVRTEQPTGNGGSIDVVLRLDDGYWFFEIKIELSARACIRAALAQLLEYAYWPGGQEAKRLIVVGEPALDSEGKVYLRELRRRFALPIDYQQMDPKLREGE